MSQFKLNPPVSLVFLVCLALIFIFSIQPAKAQGPQNNHTVFLPMIKSSNATPLPPIRGDFFVQADIKTGSAALEVDQKGGMHLAYHYYVPDEPHSGEEPTDHPAAVYLYCPGHPTDCANPAKWTGVAMADRVNEVQLALTPAGQPRLLIRLNSTGGNIGNDLYYAACDQNCTNTSGWSLTYLTTTSGMASFETEDFRTPQRSFALDSKGRPRFVYLDNTPGHRGTFYAYCDDTCTDAALWFETQIDRGNDPWYESYYYPSLAFTNLDQPRIVADGGYLVNNAPIGIYYLACDGGCDNRDNWAHVYLFERGSESRVSWDLELSGDRPRLAFYEGSQLGGGGDILSYAWCNTTCLNQANWQRLNLGLGSLNGKHPDLELDGQGRPRLAYILGNGSGVGYAWCQGNCESAQGQWQQKVVDTSTTLEQKYPVARPSFCNAGLWDSLAPVLALDSAGNPRIAFDAAYHTRCLYDHNPDDGIPPVLDFWQLWHSVRVNYFPQP